MKKIILILLMVLGYSIGHCQALKPDVIATAGSFYANNTYSVSWTIGECIPETYANATNKLTQGFQQGIYDIKTVADYTENGMKINLYPNPATDFINLEMQMTDQKDYFYQLFDTNGKCLKNQKITSVQSQINLVGYSSNSYILNVFSTDQKLLKSFKILKIN